MVHQGPGFFVIQGLDALSCSVEENTIIFLGLASYIGDQRGTQDKKGNVLCEFLPMLPSFDPQR